MTKLLSLQEMIELELINSGVAEAIAIVAASEIYHNIVNNPHASIKAIQEGCEHDWRQWGSHGSEKAFACKRCGAHKIGDKASAMLPS